MSLIFFGTPRFAVPSLQALIDAQEDVVLAVTRPDKVKGRGHVLSSPPVKDLALSKGVRVAQPSRIRNEKFYNELRSIRPEFIIVAAYGKILPEEVLEIPERGCVNVHASLLPKYRGAAPIQWALINGERVTGVTIMLMDKGMDTGDMLLQAAVEIKEEDNSETLSVRLSELGAKSLIETMKGMRTGEIKPVPQRGEASAAPPLKKGDGRIDWNKSAGEIFNFVRGMYPWPSAFSYLDSEMIKVIKVRPVEGEGVPGRIERASGGELVVGAHKGLVMIEELQPEGKRIMPAKAFLSGRRLVEKASRGFS
ncbi:MAG: methionyl-tRNA formyltransferase [Nitrospirae bacterium]|nr:methionyl-tRNA formyltransferase [Nitrospirota bacterium]MCL5238552.1 methionyl-tRNA formyltransferase [Nitrospirota bacterium]